MKCYWCDNELIIGGDVDIEEGMNGYLYQFIEEHRDDFNFQ